MGVADGEPGEKYCAGCERFLAFGAFAKDRNRRDGLQPRCRECVAAYSAQHYRRRREAMGKTVREKVVVPEGHKLCRLCGEVKPHGEWHRNATASDGLSTRCKACRAVQGRQGHLMRQYGITEAERDALIEAQVGVCCICLKAPPEHVDHCHKTGRVRGVLCFSCNAALGQFKDRPDAIRRAAAYVEGNAWKPTLVAPGVYQLPS
ncbi:MULTISPECIES: endonuclease VII domain-containing protein [Streptomyces]|uniref:Endonuclease VII domain-containing protein n=1 Tax=Streptomyces doudnae TaxID=3075536 RepID=A0ABD5EVR3_9ACTN|nr:MULTISPECIES: endonuclease VII domain-containing protein [unclassified Streptomyces]MDT0437482.1 endonuclease VII domain-containing protein [Streptomyces sp. DSM 41981]MYQ66450.1 recombination endonuclease VII [Streptomyces sp. SID4950]SCE20538.1 Recombination endonuclease VII [Streptomyces sp. SolWspMP-5a-2]